ncbi:hypothetical protein GCM10010404_79750 [Nonomuraea africana]
MITAVKIARMLSAETTPSKTEKSGTPDIDSLVFGNQTYADVDLFGCPADPKWDEGLIEVTRGIPALQLIHSQTCSAEPGSMRSLRVS